MSLESDSQPTRTQYLFDQVTHALVHRVHAKLLPASHQRVCESWLVGGSAMARSLVASCDGIRDAWSKGDEGKAPWAAMIIF